MLHQHDEGCLHTVQQLARRHIATIAFMIMHAATQLLMYASSNDAIPPTLHTLALQSPLLDVYSSVIQACAEFNCLGHSVIGQC
jgi:hypothetical protein